MIKDQQDFSILSADTEIQLLQSNSDRLDSLIEEYKSNKEDAYRRLSRVEYETTSQWEFLSFDLGYKEWTESEEDKNHIRFLLERLEVLHDEFEDMRKFLEEEQEANIEQLQVPSVKQLRQPAMVRKKTRSASFCCCYHAVLDKDHGPSSFRACRQTIFPKGLPSVAGVSLACRYREANVTVAVSARGPHCLAVLWHKNLCSQTQFSSW